MSASLGAAVRRHPPGLPHLASLAATPLILVVLAVGLASADRPATLRISAAEAAQAGTALHLVPHPLGGSTLVEVKPPASGAATGSLLAVSPDGGEVALADQVGELAGSLTLARSDGSQLRVPLPGLLGAGFAPDGTWLAVIDGRGALWRVDEESGTAAPIADGPFLGTPVVGADGNVLLLFVPSVEAPYRSQLVSLAPSTGIATAVSSDELVYAGFPLSDGSVAVVAHEPGRTVVRRVGTDGPQLMADLGRGAVNASVAPDGRRIAFELAGGIFLIDAPGAAPKSVGTGSRPCFAADGASVLVRRDAGAAAISLDGSILALTDRAAGFAGATGCLP